MLEILRITLCDTLEIQTSFLTLFAFISAPTNEAFDALPAGTLDSLLLQENIKLLTDILKYHVIPANEASSVLANGPVETLAGKSVQVFVSENGVAINGANVIAADIIASNGIVHVVDSVILPPTDPETTLPPTSVPTGKPTVSKLNETIISKMNCFDLCAHLCCLSTQVKDIQSKSAKSAGGKASKSSKSAKSSKVNGHEAHNSEASKLFSKSVKSSEVIEKEGYRLFNGNNDIFL